LWKTPSERSEQGPRPLNIRIIHLD